MTEQERLSFRQSVAQQGRAEAKRLQEEIAPLEAELRDVLSVLAVASGEIPKALEDMSRPPRADVSGVVRELLTQTKPPREEAAFTTPGNTIFLAAEEMARLSHDAMDTTAAARVGELARMVLGAVGEIEAALATAPEPGTFGDYYQRAKDERESAAPPVEPAPAPELESGVSPRIADVNVPELTLEALTGWAKPGEWFRVRAAADHFDSVPSYVSLVLARYVDEGALEQRGTGSDLRFRLPEAPAPEGQELVTPGRDQRMAAEGKVPTVNKRGRVGWSFDRAAIRDWMQKKGQFTSKELSGKFGLSSGSVTNITREFMEKGTIERVKPGLFDFCKPSNNGAPTHRPRSEPRVAPTQAPKRGVTVANTGGTIGRSGKPGLDKRRAAQGKRVARHSSKK